MSPTPPLSRPKRPTPVKLSQTLQLDKVKMSNKPRPQPKLDPKSSTGLSRPHKGVKSDSNDSSDSDGSDVKVLAFYPTVSPLRSSQLLCDLTAEWCRPPRTRSTPSQ